MDETNSKILRIATGGSGVLEKQGILYAHKRPNFGVKTPYTRFKISLYTVNPNPWPTLNSAEEGGLGIT